MPDGSPLPLWAPLTWLRFGVTARIELRETPSSAEPTSSVQIPFVMAVPQLVIFLLKSSSGSKRCKPHTMA